MDDIKNAHNDIRAALSKCGHELEKNGSESTDDTPNWLLVMAACARAAITEKSSEKLSDLRSAKTYLQSATSELNHWKVSEETISGVRKAINNEINIIISKAESQAKEAHVSSAPGNSL